MTVPLPPSDNLYKFLAISGLILVVTSVVAWVMLIDKAVSEKRLALEILGAEVRLADARWVAAAPEDAGVSGDEASTRGNAAADMRVQRLQAKLDRLRDFGRKLENWLSSVDRMQAWVPLIKAQLTAGAALMVIGFSLWYARVQRYEDRLLCARATAKVTDDDT